MSLPHRLKLEHYAWLHAKLALIIWASLYIFMPPPGSNEELGRFLVVVSALFVIVGSLISMVGMCLSTSEFLKTRFRGIAIETSGLIFATCGPIAFFIVQMLRIQQDNIYITRAIFSYVLMSFMFARTWMLIKILQRRRVGL